VGFCLPPCCLKVTKWLPSSRHHLLIQPEKKQGGRGDDRVFSSHASTLLSSSKNNSPKLPAHSLPRTRLPHTGSCMWVWKTVALTFLAIISSVQSCPTLCDPTDCSMPGLPVHHQILEFTQTHLHWVSDAIQPPHPLSSPSPPAFNLSQHQGLFKWVSSSNQVAKVLEFQLQHQSFQWTPRTDFL